MVLQEEEVPKLRQLLTNKQAAEYLHMSEVTLWRERVAGRINFRRIGGKLLYAPEDLESYCDSRLNIAAPSAQAVAA